MTFLSPKSSRLSGIYRLPLSERRAEICRLMNWPHDFLSDYLPESGLTLQAADAMVENAIGIFGLPLGLASNFVVDNRPVLVPMAVEEPSIVAGLSKAALLVARAGGFSTKVQSSVMMGQIQILEVWDLDRALQVIVEKREELISLANSSCANLVARGGGCLEIGARILAADSDHQQDYEKPMLLVEFFVDCCDAMGANIINTLAEQLAPEIVKLTGGRVGLRILSNLCDRRLATASCAIPYRLLAQDAGADFGRQIALRIAEAFSFARRDPYRACTHNKGVMNGIDALAIATGNDWRAIEAGAHAYAARSGVYRSLTHCRIDDDKDLLHLNIELPLACGIVGGATKVHPSVVKSLTILGVFGQSASALAGLMASVGLAQNLAAVLALSNEGIQKGHMKLHAKKSRVQL